LCYWGVSSSLSKQLLGDRNRLLLYSGKLRYNLSDEDFKYCILHLPFPIKHFESTRHGPNLQAGINENHYLICLESYDFTRRLACYKVFSSQKRRLYFISFNIREWIQDSSFAYYCNTSFSRYVYQIYIDFFYPNSNIF
jgi:hypothetical protein